MMAELNLEIVKPEKVIYKGSIKSVTLPGTEGNFQVLINHAPLISTLDVGLIKIEETDGGTVYIATSGGTAEVLNNKILVLTDSAEISQEIDVERAEAARERAKLRLEERGEGVDLARAEAALLRAVNRLKIAEIYIRAKV